MKVIQTNRLAILASFLLFPIIQSELVCARAQSVQTNLAVLVRHAPSLSGGIIQGSLQEINGESININSGFTMSGDLLVAGTPTVITNGSGVVCAGIIDGSGSTSPTGYQVILNSKVSLNYIRTRTTPATMPTVSVPPAPTGTRSVSLNRAGQSYGDATTLRDLTLGAKGGLVSVPPGTYGTFSAGSGAGFVLGVAGETQATTYNFQNLNLSSGSNLKIVGPVVVTVASGISANGILGCSNHPAWLQLKIAGGGLNINSGCTVYGAVFAPVGLVTLNAKSSLAGNCSSDQFTLNHGGMVQWASTVLNQTIQPPTADSQSVTVAENSFTNLTLTGTDPQGLPLTYTVLNQPGHGTLTGIAPNLTYHPATNYFGNDAFTFSVSNGYTNSGTALVSLTVAQVYYPPSAISQTLTNQENWALAVTLGGTDPQGYPLTYSVVTPPSHGTLTGNTPNLTYHPVTNYYGNDAFTFRVNDGVSDSAVATVSITNQPVDDPPLVVAGANQTIILPVNTVNLAGEISYSDYPGTVNTVLWTKVSGPGSVAFSDLSNAVTTATFGAAGAYRLRLTASDSFLAGSNEVSITVDAPPTVNAGSNITNTFPNELTLQGVAGDDGLPAGSLLTAGWSKVSGPGSVAFGNASLTNSTASFSASGIYVLRLEADDGIATNQSDVTIIENLAPVIETTASLLTNGLQATLASSVTDDGLPGGSVTTVWSQTSGPGLIAFGTPTAANTTVVASQSGTYVVVLTASDGAAISTREVVITFNQPPVVSAGSTRTVDWGTAVTLNGFASDDQLPRNTLTTTWTKVSGPGSVSFDDASLTNATASFTQAGSYILRLTADDSSAATSADVQIDVNTAPMVDAGTKQLVMLDSAAHLSGWVGDDGLPAGATVTTQWSQVSGPGTVSFADSSAANTTATFSAAGDYVLRLTADDTRLTSQADLVVLVRTPAMNTAPAAHAGSDLVVGLTNQIKLCGSYNDDGLPMGASITTTWSQVSGPGSASFANAALTNTTVRFDTVGTYTLRLTVSDSQLSGSSDVTVTVYPYNLPPVVVAGASQEILVPDPDVLVAGGLMPADPSVELSRSPTTVASLHGRVTDDGLPVNSVLAAQWSKASGPGNVTFGSATNPVTTASFSKTGTYVLRLAGSDGEYTRTDETTIVVHGDLPPVVDAGSNQVVGVDASAMLEGSASDDGLPANTPLEIQWSFVSGPGTVAFAKAGDLKTAVSFSASGTYVLRLSANDTIFTTHKDVVIQVVDGNTAPSINAWTDNTTITLPDSANLFANVSDDGVPAGQPLTYLWSLVSGPGDAVFGSSGSSNTTVAFSQAGTYVLRITASDSQLSSHADVTIQALLPGSGQSPVVIAGHGQHITLPAVASLNGMVITNGMDGDFQTNWSVVSGPGNVAFADSSALATTASFDAPGVYHLQLELDLVHDEWWGSWLETLASDQLYVIADPPSDVNQAPNVYAGAPRTVALGVPVQIHGSASDDGLPVASLVTQWRQTDGPVPATIGDPYALNTTVVFTNLGTYNLQLWASDSELESTADVLFRVVDYGAGNHPPMVDAGANQTVSSGSTAQLNGTVTDDGLPGNALSYRWRQVRGPANATINALGTLNPTVTFSEPGTYVFRLHADDAELISEADVQVVVDHPINHPPTVSAGGPRYVILPTNSVTLHGFVTDDGLPANGVLTQTWQPYFTSLPGAVTFDDPGSLNATVTVNRTIGGGSTGLPFMYAQLTASDSQLSASSLAQIYVCNPAAGQSIIQVDAGTNQTIRLPDVAYLHGSYEGRGSLNWSISDGPGNVTFDSRSQPQTIAHFTAPGVYLLTLSSIDVKAWGGSSVMITVLPATNAVGPLLVDAGPGVSVPIQNATAALAGFVSHDGMPSNNVISVQWSQVDGPGTAGFADAGAATTEVSFNAVGTYTLRLTATDPAATKTSDVTVIVYDPTQVNLPPTVDAGGDETVRLPQTVTLNATVADDGLPAPGLYGYWHPDQYWYLVSGPSQPAIYDNNSLTPTISFDVPGDYVLRLTASDGVYENSSDVTIHVLPQDNLPPMILVNPTALAAQGSPLTLNAQVIDDGRPTNGLSARWSMVSGPGTVTFSQQTDLFPDEMVQATFPAAGDYVLQIAASDGELAATNTITVTVTDLFHGNQKPVVNAGAALAATTRYPVTLHGTATDDGLPAEGSLSTLWSMDSGPVPVRFGNAGTTNTSATFYQAGTYVLRLSATDGQLAGSSLLTVTVNDPTNEAPLVYAGGELTIARPAAAELEGLVLDDDLPLGYPLTYQWTVVSGPGTVTFATSSSTNSDASAWETVDALSGSAPAAATFSTNGTYVLRLLASDTEYTNSDEVTITVLQGINSAPVVDAGPDQIVVMPHLVSLHTGVSDDGLPNGSLQVIWSQVSGPAPVNFSTVNGNTRAAFTTPGYYVLRLTAYDGELTSSDDVNVTVYQPTASLVTQISQPLDGAIITSPTQVVGTVSSPILQSYQLQYRLKTPDGTNDWVIFDEGTNSVFNGVLGVLDPTLDLNGVYEIRLTATDLSGQTSTTDPITAVFDQLLNISSFAMSFNDLAEPVPGLPLQITRTYDSRAAIAGIQGDFGVGWSLDLLNVRLQKTRNLSANWYQDVHLENWPNIPYPMDTYTLDPRLSREVIITMPGDKVYHFKAVLAPARQMVPIGDVRMTFTNLPGTDGGLAIDGDNEAFVDGGLGYVSLINRNASSFDPTRFRFTNEVGNVYVIDEKSGFQSLTDGSQNTLVIATNGITWTNSVTQGSGVGVTFVRDDQSRITQIIDPAGQSLTYTYGLNGSLATFTDLTTNTTTFIYTNAAFPHVLTGITDPRSN